MTRLDELEALDWEIDVCRTEGTPDDVSKAVLAYNSLYAELEADGFKEVVDEHIAHHYGDSIEDGCFDYKDMAAISSDAWAILKADCPDGYSCPRSFLNWVVKQL